MPFDDDLGVYQQDLGFDPQARCGTSSAPSERAEYPLLLHATYFDIYRKQVTKQADLVLAMHWAGDQFTFEQKAKAFAYYDGLTVRDSSLSACTQAVIAAEVGHLELAHAYALEAALMDLRDLERNTGDGVHVASLAGAWIALVGGFGGLRDYSGALSFRPQLPERITELAFTVRWRGARLRVVVTHGEATYLLEDAMRDGSTTLTVKHEGTAVELITGERRSMPVTTIEPITPEPTQPAGRRPMPVEEIEDAGTG